MANAYMNTEDVVVIVGLVVAILHRQATCSSTGSLRCCGVHSTE